MGTGRSGNGNESYAVSNYHNVLDGTKILFYRLTPGDNKKIIIYRVNENGDKTETLKEWNNISSSELSYTLTNGGHISIFFYSKDGSPQEAWIGFENPNY